MRCIPFLLLFMVGCGTTGPVSCPTCPSCPSCPPPVISYIHDTTRVVKDSAVVVLVPAQTNIITYELPAPSGTDDYQTLQTNINLAIAQGFQQIHISGRGYKLSRGLCIRDSVHGYAQGIILMGDGGDFSDVPTFTVTNGQACGINLIQCKGCIVENITVAGQNTGLSNYSVAQVLSADTSSFVTNGVSAAANQPHSGYVVDGLYYADVYDHSLGGSTDVHFINCRAQNFVVGFCLQPGGLLQNGEIIKISDCWADYCRSAISIGQSQERTVLVENFHCWGWTKTVFDMVNFGNGTSCPPEVHGLNVAGCVRYLCEQGSWISKGLIVSNSHIESLYSLGGCLTGTSNTLTLRDDWIALQTPPVTVYQGAKLDVQGGFLWQYGETATPISFNCYWADFDGVQLDDIPTVTGQATYRNCFDGYRFGDDMRIGGGHSAAELHTTVYQWMGSMSCLYNTGMVRTRLPSAGRSWEYFIPELVLGDLTAGSDTVKNVVVEGGEGFTFVPLYMPEVTPGTTIVDSGAGYLVLSSPALVTEANAAIVSGSWRGTAVGVPDSTSPYLYGFKRGDIIINNRPDLYANYSWICIQSGVTGTSKPPKFRSE